MPRDLPPAGGFALFAAILVGWLTVGHAFDRYVPPHVGDPLAHVLAAVAGLAPLKAQPGGVLPGAVVGVGTVGDGSGCQWAAGRRPTFRFRRHRPVSAAHIPSRHRPPGEWPGGTPTWVTAKGPSYLHGWSADGQQLVYCGERAGQYDIYTISVDGGPETQLTDEPGLDDGPEYSPSGEHIWFNSARGGLMQIWRMAADGARPNHIIVEEANCWFPHVSPDGKWVAYIAYGKEDVAPGDHSPNRDIEIRLIPAAGGVSQTIVTLFGGQGTMNVNSWSPDSRTLAFVSYRLKE